MKAVNLIPGDQRQGDGSLTGRSGGAALIVLGLLAGIAALIAFYGSAHHRISSQQGEAAALIARADAVQARAGRLSAYTSFVSMADQRTETVAQLIQARFDWSHALHELGRVLPAGTALNSLHGTVASISTAAPAAPPTPGQATTAASSTPPGSTPVFALAGCATSQSVVAQALQRLRLMDGSSEVRLDSSSESGGGAGASACPGTDATFTAEVFFAGLPAAPALSVPPANVASTTSASNGAHTKAVSDQNKSVHR